MYVAEQLIQDGRRGYVRSTVQYCSIVSLLPLLLGAGMHAGGHRGGFAPLPLQYSSPSSD